MTNKQKPTPTDITGHKRHAKLRLSYVVGSLDRIIRRKLAEALTPLGLTIGQFTVMSVLDAGGQTSNAKLAERSLITPQSANEVMSAMALRGWVTRQPDPKHGRIVLLQLTDEGREILRQCEQAVQVIEEQMLSGMAPDVGSSVQSSLELFVRNLRA
ncbi:MarR family winged helix-turn-helix transcriptional regulator [Glaciimonas soli]|uniref:MarR family transcriptional regulator n=1 Tax=Glaciimonas soli TaxID=2590999 RepID=A0A843YVU5_9BURK|nr:MarR family transcriptional regulator [Glaciimonas soli]